MDRPWIELERLTAAMVELAHANDWDKLAGLAPQMEALRQADAEWRQRNPAAVSAERADALRQAAAHLQEVAEHVRPAHESMGKLLRALGRTPG